MKKIRKILKKIPKFYYLVALIIITIFISISIPSLARFKNRNTIIGITEWDGSVATSYRKGEGTETDPYVISNGSELAYFAQELNTNDYTDNYFILNNDIVLNNGVLNYDTTDGIEYILDGVTYYVSTDKYYSDTTRLTEIGTINLFNTLNNFKGHFDGQLYTIYGLYMNDSLADELALFTNLTGDVSNLYVDNSIIYGGYITGGIVSNANGSSINNVFYNGSVIGNNVDRSLTINTDLTDKIITTSDTINTNQNLINGKVTAISLTGTCAITGDGTFTINGTNVNAGSFNVDLGTTVTDTVAAIANNATVNLTNLKYNVTYNTGIASGIVASATDVTITNAINKADIYGHISSAGLVAILGGNSTINQSYNIGTITGENNTAGLISNIKQGSTINLNNSYNAGVIPTSHSGLIDDINNVTTNITNVFNTDTDYIIGDITSSTVNVTNSYYTTGSVNKTGTITGEFTVSPISTMKSQVFGVNTLGYNTYVSSEDVITNTGNVWVYSSDELPILYFDDINNPIANINVNTYSWNNFSDELNNTRIDTSITFNITNVDELRPLKEVYYYISNSNTPLTKTGISNITSWVTYDSVQTISTEGFYVVYAKVVDYSDNVTYLNTDILVLDLSGSDININLNNHNWTTLTTTLTNTYINTDSDVNITATDNLSGISKIEYYIANTVLTAEELTNTTWTTYSNNINLNTVGTYVIYAKVTDNSNYVTYANTDYIIYNGYTMGDIILGRSSASIPDNSYITSSSTITLNYTYQDTNIYDSYTHKLYSSILLPVGAKIYLMDNITSKKYVYIIPTSNDNYGYNSSCTEEGCSKYATYPLTSFTEVGSINGTSFVDNYTGSINENFSIILDLSGTNITTNYDNVTLSLGLGNTDISINTLSNTSKKFNIYSTVNTTSTNSLPVLTTDYSGNAITYNSDSETSINLTSALNYKMVDTNKIYDSEYEDMNLGLIINMTDTDGNVIASSNLKNMYFKLGNAYYYPDSTGNIRINLGNGTNDTTSTLTVMTNTSNISLGSGNYTLNITGLVGYDGKYSSTKTSTITVPVVVTNKKPVTNYTFDVAMDNTKRTINRSDNQTSIDFAITETGSLRSPNIRVSLYKKDQLTGYNQNYTPVDLGLYISDTLTPADTNVYYVTQTPIKYLGTTATVNNFTLNLLTSKFENNGYKLVFDLYNDSIKIGSVEKTFVVK